MGKILDFIVISFLLAALCVVLYYLWMNLPGEPTPFEDFQLNESVASTISQNITQFYSNMRFKEKRISYSLEPECSGTKLESIKKGLELLSSRTILDFYQKENDGEISFLCSEIAPEPAQKDHFIAGEGGPTEIVNATRYSVILRSKVSLYRGEKCEEPKVSVHEILHALGFEHVKNKSSIMFPITDCSQNLDEDIIEEINRLYSEESLVDIAILNLKAVKRGRYVDFNILIMNQGLQDSRNSTLEISSENEKVAEFNLESTEIGSKRVLNVTNLAVPFSLENLEFNVRGVDPELTLSNNRVEVNLA
jgi:hypothetical protein